MRRLFTAIVGAVLLTGLPAFAQVAGPGEGIINSPHDFTNPGGRAYQPALGASICIFCHMQHRPGNAPPAAPPQPTRLLWNHRYSAQTFGWSDVQQTVGGTNLPTITGDTIGPSKMCLSCHDGTVSVGDLYRGKSGSNFMANWTGSPARVDSTGRITTSYMKIGATGDLMGNHPVGIPYPYQGAPSTYGGITTGSGVLLDDYVAEPVNVKLFTDAGGGQWLQGASVGATGIECASCHDPHNKQTLDHYLLRDHYSKEAGGQPSQICLNCHNK